MPLYDYQCTVCETLQEVIHGMDEEPSITCEECKASCKKVILKLNFDQFFEGNNWEDTAYRRY